MNNFSPSIVYLETIICFTVATIENSPLSNDGYSWYIRHLFFFNILSLSYYSYLYYWGREYTSTRGKINYLDIFSSIYSLVSFYCYCTFSISSFNILLTSYLLFISYCGVILSEKLSGKYISKSPGFNFN
jgi:hypothetical protein